jgi:hypothetical protein
MKRKLATTLGLAGGATLLLAVLAGPATGAGNGPIGMGRMDQDRDQLQVRDGSCYATLPTDADRDLVQLRDRDRLRLDAAGTGDQKRDRDRDRDRDHLQDGDCTTSCDNDGAQVRNREQQVARSQARIDSPARTQQRVRSGGS